MNLRKDITYKMAREIVIDTDTVVGYSYPLKEYYVYNKGTTTYRAEATRIKTILDIVAPGNTVTIARIEKLQEDIETLHALSYTIADTGAYVATMQFNDYKKYALAIDCSKSNLYIINTDTLFDLKLNEAKINRLRILRAFYLDTLGLDITNEEMELVYDFMVSFYSPTVYNVIKDTDVIPVSYSNMFALSNWNSKAKAVYNCTCNPNNTTIDTLANNVLSTSSNTITLTSSVSPLISNGSTVVIEGATLEEATYTYSADGTYVVSSISNNTIFNKYNTIFKAKTLC